MFRLSRPARPLLVLLSSALLLCACSGATSSAPPTTSGPWVMGYAVGYERDLLPLAELNWSSLTHVAVGRAVPKADGTLGTTFDIDALNGPLWAKSVVAAAHAHNVRAILMLGGAGEHAGFVGAASAANLGGFVKTILALANTYGFDGVDLDWEPLTSADEAPLLALAKALKAGNPKLLLTLPVNFVNANFPAQEARPSLAALASSFDRINIMSYGMAGVYSGWNSWHSSALAGDAGNTPTSIVSSVKAYLAAGIPAGKLGLGTGFYGLCYQGVTAPGQNTAGMKIVADDGDMSYVNIVKGYATPAVRKWDASAQVPYLSSATPLGSKGCTFVSYEDAASIAQKGSYARAQGLGGVVIWTLAQGHFMGNPAGGSDPLLDATHAAFRP